MKLLIEQIDSFKPLIVEDKETGNKAYFVEGIFLQGGIKNHNKRVYPTEVLANECSRYVRENVERNRAYGELGHPDTPNINFDRVSHLIKELRQDGNNWMGRAQIITENPAGAIVRGIINVGGTFGMSTRGTGTLRQIQEGIMEVGPDFKLATAGDIVHNPSAPDAWMKSITESADYIFDEATQHWVINQGTRQEKPLQAIVEETKKTIKTLTSQQIQEHKVRMFNKFLTEISQAKRPLL